MRRTRNASDDYDCAVTRWSSSHRSTAGSERAQGELLVHAAARHGVFVPTLCHDDKLEPYGGCRVCVVSVEGGAASVARLCTR